MTKHRFTLFIYVFLLLCAQQAAVTHAVWHAGEHAPAQHEEQDVPSFQGDLCGLDAAFSQVLGGVQAVEVHHAIPPAVAETPAHPAGTVIVLELQFPLSRGPPVFS